MKEAMIPIAGLVVFIFVCGAFACIGKQSYEEERMFLIRHHCHTVSVVDTFNGYRANYDCAEGLRWEGRWHKEL